MTAADKPLGIAVPWDKLLLWVQQQIALEMQTGQPVAMTRSQLQALSHLVPFYEEPDVSDCDYVSVLMQKIQALRLANPVFADHGPITVPVDGHFQPLWQHTCTLDTHGSFPRQGYGFTPGQQAPLFQSKKTAKQYAAKHALTYLSQPPSHPAATPTSVSGIVNRSVISPLQLPEPQAQLPPVNEPPPSKRTCLSPMPPPFTASSTPPQYPEATAASAASAEESSPGSLSVFQVVSSLTSRLAMDSPSYKIEPDPAGEGLFCGRAVFKNRLHIPPDLAVVSGACGPREAKLMVAERVVAWLQGELQRRQDIFNGLWASTSPPKAETPGA